MKEIPHPEKQNKKAKELKGKKKRIKPVFRIRVTGVPKRKNRENRMREREIQFLEWKGFVFF